MAIFMAVNRARVRLEQELKRMKQDPPHGIRIWPLHDDFIHFEALIEGPENSDYSGGEFRLTITIPDDYPNAPPAVKFQTKIYHPNIDSSGRICLDSLKPSPHGAWKPALNLATVLTQIRLLMSDPNKDDPLDTQIAAELSKSPSVYHEKARKMTEEFAVPKCDECDRSRDQNQDDPEF
jgi:ubiquitin-conjugating enzyme E2 T